VLAGVSVFYPAPGSRDFGLCRRLGLLPEGLSRLRSTALPIDHTTRPVESVTLMRIGRIVNFMKHLSDLGIEPESAPPPGDVVPDPGDRLETGRRLLAGFLADGRIRGAEPDGTVYPHAVSEPLAGRFLERLRLDRVQGARRVSGRLPAAAREPIL
jgi:hypothetical protein